MKTSIAILVLFLFFPKPADTIKKMSEAVYIPGNNIKIEGKDSNNEKILLEYDRKKDALIKTIGNSKPEKTKDIDLFLRLFFFNAEQIENEHTLKVSAQISELLKKNGIDISKTTLSASSDNGPAAISIGKEKRFDSSNELILFKNSYLPAVLVINSTKYVFSDYHKSVYPAAFPGKIEIYNEDQLLSTWFFYRKEYL